MGQGVGGWSGVVGDIALVQESDHSQSDAEHILKELASLGYVATMKRMDASAHGSRACRDRIYFIGVKCSSPMDKLEQEDFDGILQSMQLEPLPADMFLNLAQHPAPVATAGLEHWDPPSPEGAAGEKKVAVYKDDHLELYAQYGLSWPPDISSAPYHGLTRRAAEVLFFANHVWPYDEVSLDSDPVVEFLDVNNSLARLLGTKFARGIGVRPDTVPASPWKTMAMTITGHSIICIRAKVGKEVLVRKAHAYEVMALAGWDWSWWKPGLQLESESLGVSLAGNAFSAFCVAPVLTAALVAYASMLEASRSGVLKEAKRGEERDSGPREQ